MEVGETIAETCVRETFEETGLKTSIERLLGVYSDPAHVIAYDNGEVRQQFSICFICYVIGGNLRPSDESTELNTFSLGSLPKGIHPAQLQRIDDYRASGGPFLR